MDSTTNWTAEVPSLDGWYWMFHKDDYCKEGRLYTLRVIVGKGAILRTVGGATFYYKFEWPGAVFTPAIVPELPKD